MRLADWVMREGALLSVALFLSLSLCLSLTHSHPPTVRQARDSALGSESGPDLRLDVHVGTRADPRGSFPFSLSLFISLSVSLSLCRSLTLSPPSLFLLSLSLSLSLSASDESGSFPPRVHTSLLARPFCEDEAGPSMTRSSHISTTSTAFDS